MSAARQSYVVAKLQEAAVLLFICWFTVVAVARADISFVHTTRHKQNVQVLINIAGLFVVTDVLELLTNQRMARHCNAHSDLTELYKSQ